MGWGRLSLLLDVYDWAKVLGHNFCLKSLLYCVFSSVAIESSQIPHNFTISQHDAAWSLWAKRPRLILLV